jgi:hypothetical protein
VHVVYKRHPKRISSLFVAAEETRMTSFAGNTKMMLLADFVDSLRIVCGGRKIRTLYHHQ